MKTIEERKHTWETAADDATFKDTEDYNARVALWAVNNVDAMFAEIARLNALLAEALRSYHGVLKLLRTNLEFIAQGGNTANELIRTYERRAREVCCSMDALAKLGA